MVIQTKAMTFLGCPARMDAHGLTGRGYPAEIQGPVPGQATPARADGKRESTVPPRAPVPRPHRIPYATVASRKPAITMTASPEPAGQPPGQPDAARHPAARSMTAAHDGLSA